MKGLTEQIQPLGNKYEIKLFKLSNSSFVQYLSRIREGGKLVNAQKDVQKLNFRSISWCILGMLLFVFYPVLWCCLALW